MSQFDIDASRAMTAGRLLTIEQASAAMQIPETTVVRAIASGALRGVQATGELLVMTSSVCNFLVGRAATSGEPTKLATWMSASQQPANVTRAALPTAR